MSCNCTSYCGSSNIFTVYETQDMVENIKLYKCCPCYGLNSYYNSFSGVIILRANNTPICNTTIKIQYNNLCFCSKTNINGFFVFNIPSNIRNISICIIKYNKFLKIINNYKISRYCNNIIYV